MILSHSLESIQQRYQPLVEAAMRSSLDKLCHTSGNAALEEYYGQMRYHLGWVDASFAPIKANAGKMLRPLLLLLAYEAAGAWGTGQPRAGQPQGIAPTMVTNQPAQHNRTIVGAIPCGCPAHLARALPATVAIELTHNFTLIHDDIEDGDTERRHRPTVWKCWGIPQAINTGDGMFSLARLALWDTLNEEVDCTTVIQLGIELDHTVQVIIEGQYLDLSFEARQDVSVPEYLEMIRCKTAALMSCATAMGAILGTQDQTTIERLRQFGQALGIAFQVRDDILGVWASTATLGKTQAGDLYRRKKSLPILHALERASEQDKQILQALYQAEAAMAQEQVETILSIFERVQTKEYCYTFLAEQCRLATEALATVPSNGHPLARHALDDLAMLVRFLEESCVG